MWVAYVGSRAGRCDGWAQDENSLCSRLLERACPAEFRATRTQHHAGRDLAPDERVDRSGCGRHWCSGGTGFFCDCAIQSVVQSFGGGALTLDASADAVGVSGNVRASLAAVTGQDGASWLSRVRGGYDYHGDGDGRF